MDPKNTPKNQDNILRGWGGKGGGGRWRVQRILSMLGGRGIFFFVISLCNLQKLNIPGGSPAGHPFGSAYVNIVSL